MEATLIVIDSDDELARARSLVDRPDRKIVADELLQG